MVHGSMYKNLWCNAPKEALELPDYCFEDHFGKQVPSYVPRELIYDYITGTKKLSEILTIPSTGKPFLPGLWSKYNLKEKVAFQTAVRDVTFDESLKKFAVVTQDLNKDVRNETEFFDFVLNCSGHFSVPNIPNFEGEWFHIHARYLILL